MEWGYEPIQTKQVLVCEVLWAKNWTFSRLAWPVVLLWVVSLWVILSLCLSRGWIATARHSESRRSTIFRLMSPDNFFPQKFCSVFLFSGHHISQEKSESSIFSAKSLVFVGRGKGLGKDAGAAQAGEVRLIGLAQVGAPWGWWWLYGLAGGFSSNFIWDLNQFWLRMRNQFRNLGDPLFFTILRDDLGGKWRHLDWFYEILTIGLCFFCGSFDKGVDTEIYCIWLFWNMAIWGWVKLLWWMEGDVYYFDVNSWVFGFWTRSYLPGFPGISHLYNLFRAKADERKPQYWLLLLKKGWMYLTFFQLSNITISPVFLRTVISSRTFQIWGLSSRNPFLLVFRSEFHMWFSCYPVLLDLKAEK